MTDEGMLVNSLANIAKEIERLERAREVHLKATHGRFNVFTTLLDASDEVRLHTRFLAHLLDPKERHDCGRLFLDLFLEVIKLPELKNQKCQKVITEHYTGDGYIDIYLEFEQATLVIENKINAGDQYKQLERYAQYSRSIKMDCHLFYLTLDGKEPSPVSLGDLKKEDVRLISYGDDIRSWLEQCLRHTYAYVNINQTIQQYVATVNQLSGITLERFDMKEIRNSIIEKPEIIRHFDQIQHAFREVKSDLINNFFLELQHALAERNPTFSDLCPKTWSGDDIKNPATGEPVIWKITENVILEYYSSTGRLTIGVCKEKGTNKSEFNTERKEEFEKIASQCSEAKLNDPRWGVVRWILEGDGCFSNNSFLVDMLKTELRSKKVAECAEKIVQFRSVVAGIIA